MPTASKLVAAALFAALAWFISDLVKPLLPEGTQVGMLSPVNAAIGLVLGWRVMGRRAGDTVKAAFGYGITTTFLIFLWSLLIWSGYRMVRNSTRMRYDGPIDAVQDMFKMMVDYASTAATPTVIVSMLVGALVFGWLTEMVARRFS